jgi:hypothetical protein
VRVPGSPPTFVVTSFDEGAPDISDDESCTVFEFSVPDAGARTLPLTIRGISGTRTVAHFGPTTSASFGEGTFTIAKAIPGGFVAEYDLGSGSDRIVGRGVARPMGDVRRHVWPYDPREPKPTFIQRIVQSAKDAWQGAI